MSAINTPPQLLDADSVLAETDAAVASIKSARSAIGRVIYGQETVVDRSLITILAGGHGLLVGVPGLAKTKLVETLGIVLGLSAQRIQFTPDLMPSDILGSEVMDQAPDGSRSFRFLKGPVFAQLLMADEINRASPRTQSALLQAMQEYHVTVAGLRYDLPAPFHVLATQNPLEQEGTYPLPEAQLDRFLMQVDVVYPDREAERRMLFETTATQNPLEQEGTYPLPEAQLDRFLMQVDVVYPDREAERRMLFETTGATEAAAEQVLSADGLRTIQRLIRRMPVGESVVEAILNLVRSARPGDGGDQKYANAIAWGPGPRASQALMLASRARALIDGRYAPSIDDVVALAEPVLQHRMALGFAARADGLTVRDVIADLKAKVG